MAKKGQKTGTTIQCKNCGKHRYLYPYYVKKFGSAVNYCSNKCISIAAGSKTVECCSCSKLVFKQATYLRNSSKVFCKLSCLHEWMKGKRNSIETEFKKNPISKQNLNKSIRGTSFYKKWRKEIYERDGYTCVSCHKKGGRLEADHIIPFSVLLIESMIDSIETALENKRLWEKDNARTMCKDCHKKTLTYGKRTDL